MCNSTNLVVLSGYVGNVSELRQTKTSGKDVLDFSLAVQPKPRRDKDGNWINQEPLWVKVVCWNGTAEYAEERAESGKFVEVTGSSDSSRRIQVQERQEAPCADSNSCPISKLH